MFKKSEMNFGGFAVILVGWSIIGPYPIAHSAPRGRVVGGFNAIPGEFPYQVSLQGYDKYNNAWVPICGGTILNPTTILTAAHCILFDPSGRFQIVAGENNLNAVEETEQFRIIDRIVIHDQWDDFTYQNDVALFFISQSNPLEFNSYVEAIKLPPQGHVPTGLGIVTGWGTDGENAPTRHILQKLEIPIYNRGRCEAVYGDDFTESMICAGNPEGGQDACAGDSGGPLTANDLGYRYVSGIVSWGIGCGTSGYLGVYTQVSSFTSWIEYVIEHYQTA